MQYKICYIPSSLGGSFPYNSTGDALDAAIAQLRRNPEIVAVEIFENIENPDRRRYKVARNEEGFTVK